MSEPYIGEIRMFGFNFVPHGWAACNGQLLAISQNTALFSLLRTTYGGDGKTTFGLPDLRGRIPLHPGRLSSSNSSNYALGAKLGVRAVPLLPAETPSHNHTLRGTAAPATTGNPSNQLLAQPTQTLYCDQTQNLVQLHPSSLQSMGGNQPHNNFQPSLVVNFCIALQGIYPSRS